ncbi:MAG: response regulator [Patescibacteria group bacterium]
MDKKKILIVEDESTLQRALSEFLTLEGFEVMNALDGESGVELAKKNQPDIILLDIILPKKDGYEVIDDLRGDEKTKNIPIILLTNLETSENVNRAFEKGITTYLVKSDYKLEEVVNKIKETLKI